MIVRGNGSQCNQIVFDRLKANTFAGWQIFDELIPGIGMIGNRAMLSIWIKQAQNSDGRSPKLKEIS